MLFVESERFPELIMNRSYIRNSKQQVYQLNRLLTCGRARYFCAIMNIIKRALSIEKYITLCIVFLFFQYIGYALSVNWSKSWSRRLINRILFIKKQLFLLNLVKYQSGFKKCHEFEYPMNLRFHEASPFSANTLTLLQAALSRLDHCAQPSTTLLTFLQKPSFHFFSHILFVYSLEAAFLFIFQMKGSHNTFRTHANL